MVKKSKFTLIAFVVVLVLAVSVLAAYFAGKSKDSGEVLKIGVTPVPHEEIIKYVEKEFEEKTGVDLQIVEFTDYVQPNLALEDHSIDLNYFQHIPYLEKFCEEKNIKDLVSVFKVHVEPMGFYSKKSISEIKKGDVVVIPNDSTNGGRALLLLAKNNLIKLDSSDITVSVKNIISNPYGIDFKELDAAFIPRTYKEDNSVTAAVINTNYAIEAELNPLNDSVFIEDADSPYANIIVAREDNKDDKNITELINILKSDKVRDFINEKYNGSVVPVF
ncbi:MAG: MetQ/NlpA family ABC transporter substrate-binding protein [Thermotogae bacterium]|nr:MetQ/NlpA family ABC transporter substrate-binding protein [Thermotogota bacterium]HOO76189.1 MetQ/NlpA family ABC transporter substrate-binding protein [Tepiditoga sp.]